MMNNKVKGHLLHGGGRASKRQTNSFLFSSSNYLIPLWIGFGLFLVSPPSPERGREAAERRDWLLAKRTPPQAG